MLLHSVLKHCIFYTVLRMSPDIISAFLCYLLIVSIVFPALIYKIIIGCLLVLHFFPKRQTNIHSIIQNHII